MDIYVCDGAVGVCVCVQPVLVSSCAVSMACVCQHVTGSQTVLMVWMRETVVRDQ